MLVKSDVMTMMTGVMQHKQRNLTTVKLHGKINPMERRCHGCLSELLPPDQPIGLGALAGQKDDAALALHAHSAVQQRVAHIAQQQHG